MDISIVVIFGVPQNMIEFLQRAGRGGRYGLTKCLIYLLAEYWAFESFPDDSEREGTVKKDKRLRTEKEVFDFVALEYCRREYLMEINEDDSEEGKHFDGCML